MALICAVLICGCPQASDPKPASTNTTAANELTKKLNGITGIPSIKTDSTSIVLPSDFTWSAQPTGIIDPATGAVTMPAAKTTVILTASITKDGITKTKDFTIIVAPNASDLTVEDIASTLRSYTITTALELPKKERSFSIAWDTSKANTLLQADTTNTTAEKAAYTTTQDIAAVTVSLTATVTDTASKTAQKEVTLTILPIDKTEENYGSSEKNEYWFEGSVIQTLSEYTKNGELRKKGFRYILSKVNTTDKTFVASTTHEYTDGEYLPLDEAFNKKVEWMKKVYSLTSSACETLEAKQNPTLEDIKEWVKAVAPSLPNTLTDKQIYNKAWVMDSTSYTDFIALSSTEQSNIIKKNLQNFKNEAQENAGLLSGASWHEIFQKIIENGIKSMQDEIDKQKKEKPYRYTLTKDSSGEYDFTAEAAYVAGKPWYAQFGRYEYLGGGKSLRLFILEKNTTGQHNSVIRINDGVSRDKYRGLFNADGSSFDGEDSGKKLHVEISDNQDGTLSITALTIDGAVVSEFTPPIVCNFSGDRI